MLTIKTIKTSSGPTRTYMDPSRDTIISLINSDTAVRGISTGERVVVWEGAATHDEMRDILDLSGSDFEIDGGRIYGVDPFDLNDELVEGRDAPLYHFTSFPAAGDIIDDDRLRARSPYPASPRSVSMTRDYMTPYFHMASVVFVLDQEKLATKFRIVPYYGEASRLPDVSHVQKEAEERIYDDIDDLSGYLKGIVVAKPTDDYEKSVLRKLVIFAEKNGVPISPKKGAWHRPFRK